MRLLLFLFFFSALFYCACSKDPGEVSVTGSWVWVIQYANNPAYNSTPASSGIDETLTFYSNGNYSLLQNGTVADTGLYKLTSGKSIAGKIISGIAFTNGSTTDSVVYYSFTSNHDTLIFSKDFIGTVGSGARYYSRQ